MGVKLKIINPTKALIESASEEEMKELASRLSYTNTSNAYMLKKHYDKTWWKQRDKLSWEKELERLKSSVNYTLIFEDQDGKFIRPGSIYSLWQAKIPFSLENTIAYPTPKSIPWAKQLPFQLHEYQQQTSEKLIKWKHGNGELCTGAGKSAIIMKNCRETGFQSAVIAPSRNIFHELLDKFEYHLGKTYVGALGDGKRKLGKRITICIGDSITNIEPGTKEWDFFSSMQMIQVDESHTWGAESLDTACHGVFSNVPYRLFLSGTQTRSDGTEKLLQSIIGPTVHRLTTKEAIDGGFICDHEFRIVKMESSNPNYATKDILEMKRMHLLRNKNIAAFIAKLANADAQRGRQTLVLVEELNQIAMLAPLLKVPFAVAHSETKADRLAALGIPKVDTSESVEKFNKNEVKVLIGTSCISTGTNIYPTHNCVNWQGGSSEIKTKQGAVGRAVRLHNQNPWKDRCTPKDKAIIWDFDVYDIYILRKHLEERVEYYKDSGSTITRINLNAKAKTSGGV